MTQKHYVDIVMGRKNWLKMAILGAFFGLSSPFRLLLEVHVRSRFGHRYFSLFNAICTTIILTVLPFMYMRTNPEKGLSDFLLNFVTWYIFVAIFVIRSWVHYFKVRKKPGEFDLQKHSKFNGDYHPGFYLLEDYGLPVNSRTISIYYEPAIFLIIAIVLITFSQPIGWLLFVASIIYSLGYMGSFAIAEDHLANVIDDMIFAEGLNHTLKTGRKPRVDQGFEMFNWPANPEMGRQVAESLRVQTEVLDAY